MALFKSFRGGESNLASVPLHDGYVYFCIDTNNLFFDHDNGSGTVVRSQLNAKYADKLKYLKDGQIVEITPEMISSHISNTTVHITASERTNWNAAKTHADSTHARTDATKTEKSNTNGNIKINGEETIVYTHPAGTNPHGTTKSDVGLGNVGNFKAVSTVANQGLTDTEKSNARANIGAQPAGNYAPASHTSDTTVHITAAERTNWNNKIDSSAITTHNSSNTAHNDIRELITGLTTRLNTLADSDDTTLDQMSEIVSYIKNNKSLIEGITTSKVSVSDIVNNLTSTATDKPLSAAQGKSLKGLIDALETAVNSKAPSSHSHDAATQSTDGFMSKDDKKKLDSIAENANNYTHPSSHAATMITQDSTHRFVTDTEKSTWNNKADSSTVTSHIGNTDIHVTAEEKAKWNAAGGATRGTVTVSADNTSVINLPITITDTNSLTVYFRGLLLTPEVHYTATTTSITLVGFTASTGEIFTFVGGTSTSTSLNASADQVLFSDTTSDQSYDGCSTVQEALVKVPSIIKKGVTSYYGTCSASANTAVKEVSTLDSNFVLETGATVYVEFANTNTTSTIQLNIDGTGAKDVKAYGTTNMNTNMWNAGEIVQFTYNGSNWILNQVSSATTSTYGITRLNNTVNNTSTNLAATANSVKVAYDRADEAYTLANNTNTRVNAVVAEMNGFNDSISSAENKATEALNKVNSHTHSQYVEKTGCTMEGVLVAQTNTNYTTRQMRNVILSTVEPTSSDGQDGDIWLVYEQ